MIFASKKIQGVSLKVQKITHTKIRVSYFDLEYNLLKAQNRREIFPYVCKMYHLIIIIKSKWL